jgi:hypothetical protein
LTDDPKQAYSTSVPFLPKGRLAIVTDAERDAVDVDAPLTNGVEADGEVVWSWRLEVGVNLADSCPSRDGVKKA